MRSRKLLALIFSLLAIAPALAGYMTLLGAGVGSIQPVASWVSTTDPTFPSSSLPYSGPSLSTMFDSTGKLTYKPNNLLTYSNTFSNAAWVKTNATVTGGISDPFGGTNAFTIKANAGGGNSHIYQYVTGIAGMNLLETIWIRRRTGTGAVNFFTNSGTTGPAIPVTGTWQQLSNVIVGLATTYVGFTLASLNDEVDIYAATASTVTYETTPRAGDQVITTSAAYYGPRIDYDPNTLAVKGLLIEEARTNLFTQSSFASGWTAGQLTGGGPNSATAPDGTNSAYSLIPNTTNTNHYVLQSNTTSSTGVLSVFAKANGYNYICIISGGDSTYTYVNISTGVVGVTSTGRTATTQQLSNGWWRINITGYPAFTSQSTVFYAYNALQGSNTNPPAFAGDGTSGILLWGAQLEVGAFATSYIPTAASSVTRAADVVQFTGAALAALQGASHSLLVQTSDVAAFGLNLAGAGNDYQQIYNSSTVFSSRNANGGLTVTLPSGTFASPQRVGYATNGTTRSVVASGAINTGSGGYVPVGSVYLGSYSSGAFIPNIHVTSLAVWNQRLSDATLQAKSVVGASYAANDNVNPFAPQFAVFVPTNL